VSVVDEKSVVVEPRPPLPSASKLPEHALAAHTTKIAHFFLVTSMPPLPSNGRATRAALARRANRWRSWSLVDRPVASVVKEG
jgi:hypothetical protein